MADLQELIRQKAELEQQIAQLSSKERQSAIDAIRKLMGEHGLTAADLVAPAGKTRVATTERKTVAAKYKDGSGNSWTGRGLKPKWLTAALGSGKKLEDFAV